MSEQNFKGQYAPTKIENHGVHIYIYIHTHIYIYVCVCNNIYDLYEAMPLLEAPEIPIEVPRRSTSRKDAPIPQLGFMILGKPVEMVVYLPLENMKVSGNITHVPKHQPVVQWATNIRENCNVIFHYSELRPFGDSHPFFHHHSQGSGEQ